MMKASVQWRKRAASLVFLGLLGPLLTSCSSGSSTQALSGPPVYVLSVASLAGVHEMITSVSPADTEGVSSGQANLALYYKPGATVTLTANATDPSNGGKFLGWCDASSAYTAVFQCVAPPCTSMSGLTCTVTMNSDINLLATYPGVTGITISPVNPTLAVPSSTQFTIAVHGLGTYVSGGQTMNYDGSPYTLKLVPASGSLASPGTIDKTGLYTVVSPAPPSVTIIAMSTVSPSVTDATQVTLH